MENNYSQKLWGGRFQAEEDPLMEEFLGGFEDTLWLLEWDILGSIAHMNMLMMCGIIDNDDGSLILDGLDEILKEYREGTLDLSGDYEDVHTLVEIKLSEKIGIHGKKLHTARSRNDQCNLDMKLFVKKSIRDIITALESLLETIKLKADQNPWIMPGYTHLQRAQTVTFKYYLMAYYYMFERDVKRLTTTLESMIESPLGCCALAGTTHNIDRDFTAKFLGFEKPYDNFMDGVSDRDFVIEPMSDFSIIMVHLSRLSEEIVLWSSSEFDFITLDDKYTTGSSIMPQKKNPDGAELVRGKSGRIFGNLMGMLTVMKGLPLAYNKDMQEDKDLYFDSYKTTIASIQVMEKMIGSLKAKKDNLKKAVKKGFLNATEVADYLVKRGVTFRDAHAIVGEVVMLAESKGVGIEDLSIEELKQFIPVFDTDVFEYIDYDTAIKRGIKKEMT